MLARFKTRLLALMGGLVLLLGAACAQPPTLDVFGEAPQFSLVDQSGAPYTSRDLAGRAALINFIYTHCTDACPVLSANMAQVQRRLTDQNLLGSRVVILSVSVDPVHDTPAALTEYAGRYQANASGWKFLTGDWDAVYDLVTGLKIATRPPRPPADAPAPGGDEITHSTRVVLVDPQGRVRAYLHGDQATPEEIVAATRRALA